MARKLPAKRATRPNPREERNNSHHHQHQQAIHHPEDTRYRNKKVEIIPRSLAQENYLDALEDDRKSIVIATGPAGTGKSLLATMFAIRSFLEGGYRKIIICRPTVSAGEDIGFLPGDTYAKLAPWSVPILDIFKEVYSPATLEKMIKDEVVEIAPLGMVRGRTFKHAIVIFEETQNATPEQIKMAFTRIGEGTRMIVTGDLKQHDRGFEVNGLRDFIERLRRRGSSKIAICEFGLTDIQRHPVVEDVLRIYGEE
jgi:phosphate starvation-inducible PhoH-like protein